MKKYPLIAFRVPPSIYKKLAKTALKHTSSPAKVAKAIVLTHLK